MMRKTRAPREIPPPLELQCLRVLWANGEANVRQVRDGLLPTRALAYTTVMTVLERLVRKGAVARRKEGRSFLYAPLLSRESLRRAAVRELVENLFDGSERELIRYLEAQQPAAAAAASASAGPTAPQTGQPAGATAPAEGAEALDAALL